MPSLTMQLQSTSLAKLKSSNARTSRSVFDSLLSQMAGPSSLCRRTLRVWHWRCPWIPAYNLRHSQQRMAPQTRPQVTNATAARCRWPWESGLKEQGSPGLRGHLYITYNVKYVYIYINIEAVPDSSSVWSSTWKPPKTMQAFSSAFGGGVWVWSKRGLLLTLTSSNSGGANYCIQGRGLLWAAFGNLCYLWGLRCDSCVPIFLGGTLAQPFGTVWQRQAIPRDPKGWLWRATALLIRGTMGAAFNMGKRH